MTVVADIWQIIKDSREWKSMVEAARKLPELESRVAKLEQSGSAAASGYFCDHCGSGNLKRSGNQPHPTFGHMGVKQAVFTCNECGRKSAFEEQSGGGA
jgi:ribosomal protein L37AE/L43A